jgi:DNA-binding CsgD family transcriptional regulator
MIDAENAPDSWDSYNSNDLPPALKVCPHCGEGPAHVSRINRHITREHAEETALNDPEWLREKAERYTNREIGEMLDVSHTLVEKKLDEHGIGVKGHRVCGIEAGEKLADADFLRAQYVEEPQQSGIEIARQLGVAASTVYNALERAGIERRDAGATYS